MRREAAQVACALLAMTVFSCSAAAAGTRLGFVSAVPKFSAGARLHQPLSLRRTTVGSIDTRMSIRDKAAGAIKSLKSRISYSALVLATLAVGIAAPNKASAKNQFGMTADGQFYDYAPKQTATAPIGAAAGFATLTFGGMCAVAIKKDLQAVKEDQEVIEKELDRLVHYKQEFLDGVPSDRSIYASLAKAMHKDTAPLKPAKEEDEFEKNVQAYLKEEEEKNQKKKQTEKKKPDGMGKGPGSALLERPSDPDGSKADAWMNEIVIDDKPAAIADEDLKRLQRMFGGDLPKL